MSATFPRVLADRLRTELGGEWRIQGSFSLPPSLSVRIERVSFPDRIECVRNRFHGLSAPGILFAGTRRASEAYSRLLSSPDRALIPYHAGMSDEERRAIEKLLESSANGLFQPSIVATNAFGMGMDFPQLEWTLIAQTPFSLLALLQAFGRVSRDGRAGLAETFWAEEDFRIAGFLASSREESKKRAESRLSELRLYLEGDALARKDLLTQAFL
jgi:ATP-dependent DNA helicase RecQ